MRLHALVGDEEEGRAGRRPGDDAADTLVDAVPAAVCEEAAGGLEPCFERVEREEGEVYCGAGETSGLGCEWGGAEVGWGLTRRERTKGEVVGVGWEEESIFGLRGVELRQVRGGGGEGRGDITDYVDTRYVD